MLEYKPTKFENPNFKCRKCKSVEVEYRELDGDHEDFKYHCKDCNYTWYVEGSDY